jgi:hypothetical protein
VGTDDGREDAGALRAPEGRAPAPQRGLGKRGRVVVIVAVAAVLLGAVVVYHEVSTRQADDAIRTAAATATHEARAIDNQTLWNDYSRWLVDSGSGQAPGTPRIAHAFLFRKTITPTSATLTYRLSTSGEDRCFTVFKSGSATSVTILPACPPS